VILCVLVAATVAQPARAGGIYANEFGTPEMGTAGAGAEASALDASTAIPFYNPAGMTLLEGKQLIVAFGGLFPSVKFELDPATTISGGNGGQAGGPIPILTVAYVHSASERLKFGGAFFAVAGAALDYDDDWAGRHQAQKSEVAVLSLSPTVAYRFNDWFSLGGGINIMFSLLETVVAGLSPLGSQITIDGNDTRVSFNLSAMFELTEEARIGVSYMSQTEFDYAGDITRNPGTLTAPVNTTLTLAQVLRVGGYYDISPEVALLATLGWENWSALDNQFISIGTAAQGTLARNWDDTWRLGAGVHYRVDDPWLLRFGFNYDSSPTRAQDRTADLPVDRQLRFATGVQNERSDSFSWGAELLYANLGDAEIRSSDLVGDLIGTYSSNWYIGVAANAQWRF